MGGNVDSSKLNPVLWKTFIITKFKEWGLVLYDRVLTEKGEIIPRYEIIRILIGNSKMQGVLLYEA